MYFVNTKLSKQKTFRKDFHLKIVSEHTRFEKKELGTVFLLEHLFLNENQVQNFFHIFRNILKHVKSTLKSHLQYM